MLEQIACGEVGLNIDYFYSLTPRQFQNILAGYRNKQEANFKNSWEQTRQLMHTMVLPNLKKGSKLTPQQLMEFPWEKQTNVKVIEDKNTIQKRQQFWDKVTEQHFKDK